MKEIKEKKNYLNLILGIKIFFFFFFLCGDRESQVEYRDVSQLILN
jgi:hypothetical protein